MFNQQNYNFYLNQSVQIYELKFQIQELWYKNLIENNKLWKIHSFLDAQIGLREKRNLTICELVNPQYDMLYSNILQQKILFQMMNDQVLILKLSSFTKQCINGYYKQLFQFIIHVESRLLVFEFNFHLDVDLFPHFMKLIKNMKNLRCLTLNIKKDQIDNECIYYSIKELSELIYLNIQLPSDNTQLNGKNNIFIGHLLELDFFSQKLQYLNLQLPQKNIFCYHSLYSIYYNLRKLDNLTHLSLVLRGTSNYYSQYITLSSHPYEKRFDRSLSQHLNIQLLRILSDSLYTMNLIHLELDLSFQSQYLIQAYNQQTYEIIIEVVIEFFRSISNNSNLRCLSLLLKEWQNVFNNDYLFQQLLKIIVNLDRLQSLTLDLSKVDLPQNFQYPLYSYLSNLKFLRHFDIIGCSDPYFISNESVYLFRNSKIISDYLQLKNKILTLFKIFYIEGMKKSKLFKRKEIIIEIIFSYLINNSFLSDTYRQQMFQNVSQEHQQNQNIIDLINSQQI